MNKETEFQGRLLPPDWPVDKTYRGLALDGPCNSKYITPVEADNHGYELVAWTQTYDEWVYMQKAIHDEQKGIS